MLGLCAALLALPAAAGAACTLTLILVPCIQVDWPSQPVSFGTVQAGTTTTSAEQLLSISANTSWGVRVSADVAGGRAREWNGSSYVAGGRVLTHPVQWSLSSLGGAAQGLSFSNLLTTTTGLLSGRPSTGCVLGLLCGTVGVGVRLRLRTSFADQRVAPNTYRLQVSYDAQTGF